MPTFDHAVIADILAADRAAQEHHDRQQEETRASQQKADRRSAVLHALLMIQASSGPTSRLIPLLGNLLAAVEATDQPDAIDRLPEGGEGRRLLLQVLGLIGAERQEEAKDVLLSLWQTGLLAGEVRDELLGDASALRLTSRLGIDLMRLLGVEIKEERKEPAAPVEQATAEPQPEAEAGSLGDIARQALVVLVTLVGSLLPAGIADVVAKLVEREVVWAAEVPATHGEAGTCAAEMESGATEPADPPVKATARLTTAAQTMTAPMHYQPVGGDVTSAGPIGGEADKTEVTASSEEMIVDKESLAIVLLVTEPNLSVPEIAERLHVSRTTPHKWEKFKKAAEKAGTLLPRGPKAKDGTIPKGFKTKDGRTDAFARGERDE